MTARLQAIEWTPALALAPVCAAIGVLAGIDPWLAIVAALGFGFVLLTFADLTAGLVILIVVVFAETTPLAGPALSFTKIVGVLLALAWIARLATQPAGRERVIFNAHPAFSYLLILFLGWVAISISWAESSTEGLSDGSRFLLVAALYVIVYTAVRTRRQAAWVLAGLVAGAAGTAAYGLAFRPVGNVGEAARLTSTFQDPNVLAAILVAGLALSVAGFLAARGSPWLRLGAGGAAALCLTAFFLTGSRGGLVAFGVALLTMVVVAGRRRGAALLAALLLALSAVGYYTLYAPPEIRDRVGAATRGEVEREEGRFTIWAVGWRMVEDNPVQGVGVGNFQEASIHYVLEPGTVFRTDRVIDQPGSAHNTYLDLLAELGIVGAALFLAIVGFSLGCAAAAARAFQDAGDWRMEILARGLIVAAAGVLAANFFISELSGKVPWLLLSLGPALLAVARSRPEATAGD